MQTPNITQAQIAAIVAAVAAVIGIVQTAPERLQLALLVVLGAIAVSWIVSDAIVRHGRSGNAAAQANLAAVQVQSLPADGDDSVVDATPAA